MRWQTAARWVLACALVGVAGLVVYQWRGRTTIADPVGADGAPAGAPLTNSAITLEREQGTTSIVGDDGREIYNIAFERMRAFTNDRSEFEGVTTTFMRNGVKHTMTAPMAILTGRSGPSGNQPDIIFYPKGVALTAADGVSVTAEGEATLYNSEQKLRIPGAMSFARGRLSGGGVGADLYIEKSVLWILDQAQLRVAPELEGGTPIDASAKQIGLAENDHYMILQDNASIAHQSQRLTAGYSRVAFTPVGDIVQFIELRGNAAVRSIDTASTRPTLTAASINMAFSPETGRLAHTRQSGNAVAEMRESGGVTRVTGTEIETAVGPDGETLTKLQATAPVEVILPSTGDQPAKTITANALLAEGDRGGQLSRALFSGAVTYRENRPAGRGQPASSMVATSEQLTLGIKGNLSEVDTATFRQNFEIKDGDLMATAAEGQYDSRAEVLKLRGLGRGARPKVVDGQFEVEAPEIDADLKNDAFDARQVGAERVDSFILQGTTKTGAGLFEGGKPIAGTSSRLRYSKATGRANYEGTAYLRQGEGSLAAERIDLDERKSDLTAVGKVTSRIVVDDGNAANKGKATQINANELVYTDATRIAVYTGAAQMTSANGEVLTGESITLTLEPGERRLKTMEAVAAPKGDVRVLLLEGREAIGRTLHYDAATGKYRVHGTPARVVVPAPERGPGECTVTSATELSVSRDKGGPDADNKGGAVGAIRDGKCAEVRK